MNADPSPSLFLYLIVKPTSSANVTVHGSSSLLADVAPLISVYTSKEFGPKFFKKSLSTVTPKILLVPHTPDSHAKTESLLLSVPCVLSTSLLHGGFSLTTAAKFHVHPSWTPVSFTPS